MQPQHPCLGDVLTLPKSTVTVCAAITAAVLVGVCCCLQFRAAVELQALGLLARQHPGVGLRKW